MSLRPATIVFVLLFLPAVLFAAPDRPTDLPPDATSDSVATRTLVQGGGEVKPIDTDLLRMRYALWNTDGKTIAEVKPPATVLLPVTKMIPGWRTAVAKMVEGEQQRAWIPESLGAKGKVSPGGMLIIDTELIEILHAPETPEDVTAPPEDAIKTRSGLAYKVLRDGHGTRRPRRGDNVRVHYSGWTTDGKMFDSSFLRGDEAEFGLDGVIAGWTEGLQLMTEGQRMRFWIPSKLAYGRERGKPQGMLVFDIELISIH